jgi:hypothetical protein
MRLLRVESKGVHQQVERFTLGRLIRAAFERTDSVYAHCSALGERLL